MNESVNINHACWAAMPTSFRLSEWLGRRGGSWWQRLLTRWVHRRRTSDGAEWFPVVEYDPYRLEVQIVAPRVPLRFLFTFKGSVPADTVKLETWADKQWQNVPIEYTWSAEGKDTTLQIRLNRLIVTQRVRMDFGPRENEFDAFLEILVADYPYRDRDSVHRARTEIDAHNYPAAEQILREYLTHVPNHYIASDLLARLYLDQNDLVNAQRWSLSALVASDGRRGRDVLTATHTAGASDLPAEIARLREASKDWELEKHYGTVCLLYEQNYWLGFEQLHLVRRRKIIDIRRKAAARLMHTIRFRYTSHNEILQFARLRVLGSNGTIQEVPREQLALIDSPENDASIFTEEWKEAVYTLPELESGEVLELEYHILHSNRFVTDGRPDFFIKADLNLEHPVWESTVQIKCPHSWNVQCIPLNGAPPPVHTNNDSEWQSYQTTVHDLAYDAFATESEERGMRSPLVCCAWGWKNWEEFGHDRREFYINLPVDEVPEILNTAMAKGETAQERLCLAFEWIRDRLKYASLPSAKKRIGKTGTAEKIVATGVGDCVDRAYLLGLIARSLGLEFEYVLAATRGAPLVAEVPAEQFDHVFIRVRNGDGWVYLDGTSAQTPFGQPPWEQQGTFVLGLGPQIGLIEVPVDDPAVNRLDLSESLTCDEQGGMAGTFAISAAGVLGRILDRRWKGSSMSYEDPDRAAKFALGENFSAATLADWTFRTDPLARDSFELAGSHRRNPLEEMGGKRFGVLEWHFQAGIPFSIWKERIWKDVAILPLTLTLALNLDIQPPPGWRIEGRSQMTHFDNEFATVLEHEHWDGPKLRITRQLIVKRRKVTGAEVERMPEFLHALESAQKLSVMLCRD